MQNTVLSVKDPAFAAFLSPGGAFDLAGVAVDEDGAIGLSGFYRACALISGTLASLPLRSLREPAVGQRERVTSVFDEPDGPDGQTAFEWKESLFLHMLLHGNAFALKVHTEAGGLARLPLVHPLSVTIEAPTVEDHQNDNLPVGGKWFRLTLADGKAVRYDGRDLWHVPAMSVDGLRGLSLIDAARISLGTAIAGDEAAARMFSQGALISGMVTPTDEDLEPDDVTEIRRTLDNSVQGHDNAGKIAILSRKLNFSPWTMSAADAQFLQSRQFQIEEIARWTGVPPHLLMQTEKQTSWGTGIEEQNRALGRNVLAPWASRVEQRGSRLLAKPRFIEFDFSGLERPSPDKEIELLLKQTGGKPILTVNEARAIRNLPPVEGGDVLIAAPASEPEPTEGGSDAPPTE